MNTSNFDPIYYLNLSSLEQARQEELRPKIYQHMAYYLLTRFLEELPEDKYLEAESRAKAVKSPEEVFEIVRQYEPDFEVKKLEWLEEYRQNFHIDLIEEEK